MTRQDRQLEAHEWAKSAFGMSSMTRHERARRFLEEAIELAQAAGVTILQSADVMRRVYSRPAGVVHDEFGQAGLTLEMCAEAFGYDLDRATQREFDRVRSIPNEVWKERLQKKIDAGIAV